MVTCTTSYCSPSTSWSTWPSPRSGTPSLRLSSLGSRVLYQVKEYVTTWCHKKWCHFVENSSNMAPFFWDTLYMVSKKLRHDVNTKQTTWHTLTWHPVEFTFYTLKYSSISTIVRNSWDMFILVICVRSNLGGVGGVRVDSGHWLQRYGHCYGSYCHHLC